MVRTKMSGATAVGAQCARARGDRGGGRGLGVAASARGRGVGDACTRRASALSRVLATTEHGGRAWRRVSAGGGGRGRTREHGGGRVPRARASLCVSAVATGGGVQAEIAAPIYAKRIRVEMAEGQDARGACVVAAGRCVWGG